MARATPCSRVSPVATWQRPSLVWSCPTARFTGRRILAAVPIWTVFKVNTDGTGYAVLKSFTRSDVAAPFAGLVLSDGTLYGTTYFGGSSDLDGVQGEHGWHGLRRAQEFHP